MYASASTNNLSVNKTEPKPRAGRWYQDNQYGSKVDAGDYASPGKPYYSADSSPEEADRNDKSKYNVPTSFADFIPDQKYSSSKIPSKSRPPQFGDWKGYAGDMDYAAPWAFPTDMIAVMNAMKEGEKDTGLLAKLKAEPIAVFLGLVLPLTLIFAAVWPSLLNFFMNGSMGPQTITTTASGDNGGNGDNGSTRKGDNPSYVANILGAIENFSQKMLIDKDDKKEKKKH
ncbi:uncharacterized protein TNCT_544861 [Trichonephila clavata]|uniref:Uncharacterized protein n=1 Tax=Trichonephila clavata TaxID=2740835 RepID=A0A8X6KIN9_TRICU|nr:uncharacterized protein TNCT_544861 [Trichonephila clavata]